GLDLVEDEQDAALLAHGIEPLPPATGWLESADRLDRLGDDGRGVGAGVEAPLGLVETRARAVALARAAVAVGVGQRVREVTEGHAGRVAVALGRARRQGAEGEAVVGVVEVGDRGLAGL